MKQLVSIATNNYLFVNNNFSEEVEKEDLQLVPMCELILIHEDGKNYKCNEETGEVERTTKISDSRIGLTFRSLKMLQKMVNHAVGEMKHYDPEDLDGKKYNEPASVIGKVLSAGEMTHLDKKITGAVIEIPEDDWKKLAKHEEVKIEGI